MTTTIRELERSIENNKLMARWMGEAALNLSCLTWKMYHDDGRPYTPEQKVYVACCKMRDYALKARELMTLRLKMKGGMVNVKC